MIRPPKPLPGPAWTAWTGLDRLDWPGLAWTGLDRLDWPGLAWTGLDRLDWPGPACMAYTAWTGLHGLGAAPGHRLLRRGRSRLFQATTDLGPQARPPAACLVAWPIENTDPDKGMPGKRGQIWVSHILSQRRILHNVFIFTASTYLMFHFHNASTIFTFLLLLRL